MWFRGGCDGRGCEGEVQEQQRCLRCLPRWRPGCRGRLARESSPGHREGCGSRSLTARLTPQAAGVIRRCSWFSIGCLKKWKGDEVTVGRCRCCVPVAAICSLQIKSKLGCFNVMCIFSNQFLFFGIFYILLKIRWVPFGLL